MKLFKIPLIAGDVFVTKDDANGVAQTKYIIGDINSFTEITAAESAVDQVVLAFGGGTITFTTDGANDDEKHANAIKVAAYISGRIAEFSGDKSIAKGAVADLIPSIQHMVSNAGLIVTGGNNNTAVSTIAQT
tara:strand:+ start:106 stop:504 length:399 start_codon:yes stop_codon:yes gene_type:complete